MDKSLELEDIAWYPAKYNEGYKENVANDFAMYEDQKAVSLPIFTRPIKSIVDSSTCNMWMKNGIRPIIPLSESMEFRLESCCHVFTSFTLEEVKLNFANCKRVGKFWINIEHENGHDIDILNTAADLKKIYGDNIYIMAGPIGNPNTYVEYCRAGIDYTRVGLFCKSSDDPGVFGAYYPMASLLMDIKLKFKAAAGFKQTKIVVDGGISSPADIVKCIALGADYVIIGKEFSKLLESAGSVNRSVDNHRVGEPQYEPIANVSKLPKDVLQKNTLWREYTPGNWVKITSNIETWLGEMYNCFNYAFTMTSAHNWEGFKNNVNYISLS